MAETVFTRPVRWLSGKQLAQALKTYRFVGRDSVTGKLNAIQHTQRAPHSLRTLAVPQYPNGPLKGTLEHLTEGVDVFTVHQHIGPGKFQPMVAEVLAQIPEKYQGIATHIQVLGATEISNWHEGGSRWVGQLRLYRFTPKKAPARKRDKTASARKRTNRTANSPAGPI